RGDVAAGQPADDAEVAARERTRPGDRERVDRVVGVGVEARHDGSGGRIYGREPVARGAGDRAEVAAGVDAARGVEAVDVPARTGMEPGVERARRRVHRSEPRLPDGD